MKPQNQLLSEFTHIRLYKCGCQLVGIRLNVHKIIICNRHREINKKC